MSTSRKYVQMLRASDPAWLTHTHTQTHTNGGRSRRYVEIKSVRIFCFCFFHTWVGQLNLNQEVSQISQEEYQILFPTLTHLCDANAQTRALKLNDNLLSGPATQTYTTHTHTYTYTYTPTILKINFLFSIIIIGSCVYFFYLLLTF